jgi:hypothetical protein
MLTIKAPEEDIEDQMHKVISNPVSNRGGYQEDPLP